MDARRFDLIARGVARIGTRRSFLRAVALAAGGSVAVVKPALALDSAASSTGGVTGASGCPPSRQPTRKVTATAPFPVFIVGGTCDDLDETVSYNLIDAGAESTGDKRQGSKKSIAAASSMTSIRVLMSDLLAQPHAVIVRAGSNSNDLIACGEVGGVVANKTMAIGLQERNGSGYAGVAALLDANPQTTISLYVAQNLFELVDSWQGQTVVATDDINLRATASDDGAIVTVLGAGSTLLVTGSAQGDWLPVTDDATGDNGFVNVQFVELQ